VIVDAGFGPGYTHFSHRLGHGIGMDGHEWPYLVQGNSLPLAEGMTFSDEPGIYIRGEFGVRLEDDMHITGDGAKLYADLKNAAALKGGATLPGFLKKHLARIGDGDYFAVLGYITMNETHEEALQVIRLAVRDNKKVATVLGFGPRFLHSTGQAYKGGPNSGVFLQITCDDAVDILVPGQKYTFGVVKSAQARGDFAVLAERGRRALRVHLGKDVAAGLATLTDAIHQALA